MQDDRVQYIDAQGVLLPAGQVEELGLKQPLPQIVNEAAKCPKVGQVWPGQDIQAALTVLSLLSGKPYFREITAVDVDNRRHGWRPGQSPIVLFAGPQEQFTRIRFGAMPTGDLPPIGEPTVERKLGYLDNWYRLNRRLAGPETLDLRYSTLMVSPEDYLTARRNSPS